MVHLENPPIRRQKRKDIPEPKRSLTPLWLVCKVSIPAAGWRRSNWQPYIRVDSSSGSALYIGSENGAQVVFDSTWGLRVLADTIIFGQNSNDQKSLIFHNGQIKNLSLPGSPNDAANKQYVDEHAGAKVILGSYVGTGKSGKSNPNQITLAAPFKILCIYGMQWPDSYRSIDNSGTGETSVIIPGSIIPTEYTSGFGFFYSSNSRDSYGKKSADGKTFSWYYNYTPSDAATVQLNLSQVVYHYYAIV